MRLAAVDHAGPSFFRLVTQRQAEGQAFGRVGQEGQCLFWENVTANRFSSQASWDGPIVHEADLAMSRRALKCKIGLV